MTRNWLKGHLTQVVTLALGALLAAAATGAWSVSVKLEQVIERVENRDDQYQSKFREHDQQLERIRIRIRWLEQTRKTELTIWDP